VSYKDQVSTIQRTKVVPSGNQVSTIQRTKVEPSGNQVSTIQRANLLPYKCEFRTIQRVRLVPYMYVRVRVFRVYTCMYARTWLGDTYTRTYIHVRIHRICEIAYEENKCQVVNITWV
jgi:hypothetical protein